jgi:hypothetical protein
LKVRDDYLKSASGKSQIHKKSVKDERVFPFDFPTAYDIWKNALTKSGMSKKDTSTNRMTVHPHVLRKFFRTKLGAVIPVDIVESLMGHEGYLTEVYRRYSFEDLGKFYQDGEHALVIFGSREDAVKLKKEMEEENRKLQTLVNSLATENINLKGRLETVEKEVNEIKEFIQKTKKVSVI